LKRQVQETWTEIDVLLLPTTGTTYTVAEVEADPITLNSNLGYYTNCVNLLDCCAVAVPQAFSAAGLPFGVSLIAPAWSDRLALSIADRLHRSLALRLGATAARIAVRGSDPNFVPLAVVGEHMRGQPLNRELISLGARFAGACRTSCCYRLYALEGFSPPKPGLVRVSGEGSAIEVEIWELPAETFGRFVSMVRPPLAIGTVVLYTGECVNGFICEQVAVSEAQDITHFGSWRAFQARSQ
jgi:allophanate hydrolase